MKRCNPSWGFHGNINGSADSIEVSEFSSCFLPVRLNGNVYDVFPAGKMLSGMKVNMSAPSVSQAVQTIEPLPFGPVENMFKQ